MKNTKPACQGATLFYAMMMKTSSKSSPTSC